MKLNVFQRKAMLLRTANAIRNGSSISDVYPYLGDLLPQDGRLLVCASWGKLDIEHVRSAVQEHLEMPLGTELDVDTANAFAQAKEALRGGKSVLEAWPTWYTSGYPTLIPPPALSDELTIHATP